MDVAAGERREIGAMKWRPTVAVGTYIGHAGEAFMLAALAHARYVQQGFPDEAKVSDAELAEVLGTRSDPRRHNRLLTELQGGYLEDALLAKPDGTHERGRLQAIEGGGASGRASGADGGRRMSLTDFQAQFRRQHEKSGACPDCASKQPLDPGTGKCPDCGSDGVPY